jgi:hypothetical protein
VAAANLRSLQPTDLQPLASVCSEPMQKVCVEAMQATINEKRTGCRDQGYPWRRHAVCVNSCDRREEMVDVC